MPQGKIPFNALQEHIVYSDSGARVSKIVQLGYWGDDQNSLRLKICKVKDGRISNGIVMDAEEVQQFRALLQRLDFGK